MSTYGASCISTTRILLGATAGGSCKVDSDPQLISTCDKYDLDGECEREIERERT